MYYDGDPILIAETAHEPKGDGKYYLLARWGDGLKSWEWFMSHYLNQKRALIPSLRWHFGTMTASIIPIASYFLLPIDSAPPIFSFRSRNYVFYGFRRLSCREIQS